MRGWERSVRQVVCGKCCSIIAIGDPMFVYANAEFKWRKFRCVNCAGPAPPDLPELEIRTPMPIQPTKVMPKPARAFGSRVREVAEDWKTKQSGEPE